MQALAPVVLLLVSLVIGILARKTGSFPENTHLVLNQYLIVVALPAMALLHIPNITLQSDLLFPVVSAWIVFFFAIILFRILSRWLSWDRKTTGCLILTAGLGNTAFLGLPVIQALYGGQGLQIALMMDQPGSFVITTSLAVVVASVYASENARKRDIFRNVATFPPFLFFTLALVMNLSGLKASGVALEVLENLAATLTPLALISVGWQLRWIKIDDENLLVIAGLVYKLILGPGLLFFLFVFLFGGGGLVVSVSILMAGMPPMITGAIIATSFGLHPKLASIMVALGTLLSAVTLSFWYLILEWTL